MESKKSIKTDREPKRTFFVEIGFFLSLVILVLLLELLNFFSATDACIITPLPKELPVAMIKVTLQDQKAAPADFVPLPTPPSKLMEAISNNMMVDNENNISADTKIKLKTPLPEEKLPDHTPEAKPEADVDEPTSYTIIEEKPEFPGGTNAMLKFLGDNMTYPRVAKDAGISGVVMVSFLVEKDGTISNIKVVKGIGGGCDEEANHVISMMPKWKPGKQHGKYVRTQLQLQLVFYLTAN